MYVIVFYVKTLMLKWLVTLYIFRGLIQLKYTYLCCVLKLYMYMPDGALHLVHHLLVIRVISPCHSCNFLF